MLTAKILMSGLIACGLALAPTGILAAGTHTHAGSVEIRLDNGKKWPTDAALRRGMGEIRTAMAEALPPIHVSKFSRGDFEQLAARVQGQVDHVTANCKLPEEADRRLHAVLEAILEGIAVMKSDTKRAEGAVKIVQALELYGANFSHAGWKSLKH